MHTANTAVEIHALLREAAPRCTAAGARPSALGVRWFGCWRIAPIVMRSGENRYAARRRYIAVQPVGGGVQGEGASVPCGDGDRAGPIDG